MATKSKPKVAIMMGSKSDLEQMQSASDVLKELGVPHQVVVTSAHRSPDKTRRYVQDASRAGVQVFVVGAGRAAHLAGAVSAHTPLPVLGVPLESGALRGFDALLSTVQMPAGIPVGTLAIGSAGAENAGILAAQILSLSDKALAGRISARRAKKTKAVPGVIETVGGK